ncbi:FtsK/SpoIIIE domain-containing protein [Nocardia albiluteola]|nr:FtsK/SpoIIIE domain-containing protein [Nocardia albiluteola]
MWQAAGAPLEPSPDLVVVVTGFTELLSEVPDFATVLTAVGRLGRTLGVYLLLASQRLDETLLRGLESHLSYRIGLKTFSASESRVLLDVPDAYTLPSAPGGGFLRTHPSGELIRFMTAHSSRAVLADRANGAADVADRPLWEVIVDSVPANVRRTHQVWLPPLGVAPTVGALMSPTPGRKPGLSPVAIGIVDKPQYHRYDLLFADLSGSQGNVAIVGGPQAGKSTALLTLILALAAAHTPAQVQFYCLGFSGGAMSALAGLAHVGAVAGRRDLELARRTLAELTALVQRRGEIFRRAGIDSMREYRCRKAELADAGADRIAGDPVGSDPFGDVFLVIDGYDIVRGNFEALESIVADIASRGLAFGVHIVLSAGRWAVIRPALKDRRGTRVELRLGDPTDSEPGRKMASSVPLGRPGRGLTPDGEHIPPPCRSWRPIPSAPCWGTYRRAAKPRMRRARRAPPPSSPTSSRSSRSGCRRRM